MKHTEMENYYSELEKAFAQSESSDYYNTDREHNAAVFTLMLDVSKKILMYCGELSILRNSFYQKVIDRDEINGGSVMDKMYESLKNFFGKPDSHMKVILENETQINDFHDKETVEKAISNNQLEIFFLDNNLSTKANLNHFTITDKQIVRVEQDKEEHTAICTFHDSDYYKTFNSFFDKLLLFSKKLNLKD